MLFSSIGFLYYFLPVVFILYFLVPHKLKNLLLLISSLFFYVYGEPGYTLLIVMASVSGYLHGLWIYRAKGGRFAKVPLVSSVVVGIGLLLYYKYADFLIENINHVLLSGISPLNLALPLGISFYTFQILSYTIDVYRGDAKVQKNPLTFMAYVSLFPQLIAGPIVRYSTIEQDLAGRKHSWADTAYGINRFIIGLSKKVILANTLGEIGRIFTNTGEKSVLLYWLYAVSFMLQIYFDFSGYSDMAIGLGRIFGFHFLENFNYPFIAKSLSEFWRRWHISLGTWFRDYVYIPMGGNRVNTGRWVLNLTVVWFLTGFWHGAQWNFIVWGLYFALFLGLEKLFIKRLLDKMPSVVRHLYTLFFIAISFVLFNADGIGESLENLKGMLGMLSIPFSNPVSDYYLKSYGLLLVVAAIGATPLIHGILEKAKSHEAGEKIANLFEPVAQVALLLLVTGYLVDGSFNPFLYFRF